MLITIQLQSNFPPTHTSKNIHISHTNMPYLHASTTLMHIYTHTYTYAYQASSSILPSSFQNAYKGVHMLQVGTYAWSSNIYFFFNISMYYSHHIFPDTKLNVIILASKKTRLKELPHIKILEILRVVLNFWHSFKPHLNFCIFVV